MLEVAFIFHHLDPEARMEISMEFHHESPTALGLHFGKIIAPNMHPHHFPQVIEPLVSSEYLAT